MTTFQQLATMIWAADPRVPSPQCSSGWIRGRRHAGVALLVGVPGALIAATAVLSCCAKNPPDAPSSPPPTLQVCLPLEVLSHEREFRNSWTVLAAWTRHAANQQEQETAWQFDVRGLPEAPPVTEGQQPLLPSSTTPRGLLCARLAEGEYAIRLVARSAGRAVKQTEPSPSTSSSAGGKQLKPPPPRELYQFDGTLRIENWYPANPPKSEGGPAILPKSEGGPAILPLGDRTLPPYCHWSGSVILKSTRESSKLERENSGKLQQEQLASLTLRPASKPEVFLCKLRQQMIARKGEKKEVDDAKLTEYIDDLGSACQWTDVPNAGTTKPESVEPCTPAISPK
jgi:hypothetical protein